MLNDPFFLEVTEIFEKFKDLDALNQYLHQKTGLINFFQSYKEINEYINFLKNHQLSSESHKDLGDFQTPNHLTDMICKYLFDNGFNPTILIEPTCGTGNFIISSLRNFPSLKYIYCIEIQRKYELLFKLNLLRYSFKQQIPAKIEFSRDNIFKHQFSDTFKHFLTTPTQTILVLGNPPWITNTELSVLNSQNVPLKSNIKGVKGIEAITGKGNFDIAEFILLQMINQFSAYQGKIALLCKTAVVKTIIKDIRQTALEIHNIQSLLIDTSKEFNINAEGTLFLADLGPPTDKFCTIASLYEKSSLTQQFGWVNDKFVSDIEKYKKLSHLDGQSPFEWRQGVKHDAAKTMVLKIENQQLFNGFNEKITIEEDLLYPFIKSSDLQRPVIKNSNRRIILTQTSLKQETNYIAEKYPSLWTYLISHASYLDNRKSKIYKNRPRFSIFGIGDYTFQLFKVGISGFYKEPQFSLIFPINNKPVILDDTCYYLFFKTLEDAFFSWLLLNSDSTKQFLSSLVFLDAKRPYTKEVLMRIDLSKVVKLQSYDAIMQLYHDQYQKYLPFDFSESDFVSYTHRLSNNFL